MLTTEASNGANSAKAVSYQSKLFTKVEQANDISMHVGIYLLFEDSVSKIRDIPNLASCLVFETDFQHSHMHKPLSFNVGAQQC